MIINIPLQIDEQKMEEVVARDYEGKILDEISKYIRTVIASKAEKYYGDKVSDGLRVLIEGRIDEFLGLHEKEILERASGILAEKLARSKRGKEILEDLT